jgi:hypothetical protein
MGSDTSVPETEIAFLEAERVAALEFNVHQKRSIWQSELFKRIALQTSRLKCGDGRIVHFAVHSSRASKG